MPNPPQRLLDGDSHLRRGMNSLNPLDLVAGFYATSVNMLNRGGVLQTRPGYRWMTTLPDGLLQGFTVFRPLNAPPQFILVIEGLVYRSYFPFEDYVQVEGVFLSPTLPRVYFCQAIRSVRRKEDDSLEFIDPVAVLFIQDGINAPVYYDGTRFEAIRGAKTTPMGTVMAWSGDRLWVANGPRIYVSDISDPVSFFEDTYNTLGGRQSFSVVEDVTAMAETPGAATPQLLVFTQNTVTVFQSNVRERSTWPTLQDFQKNLFNVGCVSQRSLVEQHGVLYWMSNFGLVSFDSAALSLHSSELRLSDNEMAWSKARMNGYMSSIAASTFENYLIISIPHTSYYNPHTWVLDFTVRDTLNDQLPKAWASVWAGTRPVEWVSTEIYNVPRIFQASTDADGKNRIWEAFTSERRDEFCDIDWSFETRAYTTGNITQKEMRFVEMALSDAQGAVDLSVKWAGATKGRWHEIANFRIYANEGNIFSDEPMPDPIFGLKKQSRLFRTQDVKNIPVVPPDGCDVESVRLEAQDMGFQLCVAGSGPLAVQSVRLFMDDVPDPNYAACPENETDGHFVRVNGCGSRELAELAELCADCGSFFGVATVTASYGDYSVTVTESAFSCLSQAAADKLAEQRAWAIANIRLRREGPRFLVGPEPGPDPGPDPGPQPGDWRYDFSVEKNSFYIANVF